jgi:basic membrane protein A
MYGETNLERRVIMKRNGIILAVVLFTACAWVFFADGELGPSKAEAKEALKAAFIYVGPVGDLGWSWEHDTGRKMLEAELGDKVKTTFIESVPEGPDAARVIRSMPSRATKSSSQLLSGIWTPCWKLRGIFPGSILNTARDSKPLLT